MKEVKSDQKLKITNEAKPVLLTTTIGNGDIGGGNVANEQGKKIATGMLSNAQLGTGAELRGKIYVVTTNGLDINPNTDIVPVMHKFSGEGCAPAEFKYPQNGEEADQADGLISYIIHYSFV